MRNIQLTSDFFEALPFMVRFFFSIWFENHGCRRLLKIISLHLS